MEHSFQRRPVTEQDLELLLYWRNDPVTRKNSFSKEEVSPEAHRTWLSRKLQDPGCIMDIISRDGTPVGVLRLDCEESSAEISYTVAPEARGTGCGSYIVSLAEQIVPEGISVLKAEVLPDNPASIRCFERNGFSCIRSEDALLFSKTIR